MTDELDFNAAIDDVQARAAAMATTNLGEDPDQAAKAMQLSAATGVPADLIHGDMDHFEQMHKASLAKNIVQNNPTLADLIRNDRMAAIATNDDLGALDKFSRSVPQTSWLDSGRFKKYVYDPVEAGIIGAATGAKEGFLEPYREEDLDLTSQSTPVRYAFHALDLGHRVLGAVAGAAMGGVGEFARQEAEAITGDKGVGESIGREARGILESEMGRGGEHTAHPVQEVMGKIEPWAKAGEEPPRGLHPMVDEAKAELNATALDLIDQNLADAAATITRERSPELFQKFAEEHYANSSIAIAGDRAVELYGDGRIPAPDDGLLGWVPDMESKLEAARELGEDVHIPLADWVAKVDPALAKELHDDIRVWPGGITAREAAEPWEPRPVVDAPMAQARAAMGTEPMFAIGDRKLELKPVPSGHEGLQEFQFHDEAGKLVGELTVIPDPKTKQLYVANINGLAGLYSNSFGPSLVRDLKRQLKAFFPEYETVTGHRVSGARERAGVVDTAELPVVRLAVDEAPKGWGVTETSTDYQDFRNILENAARQDYGRGVSAKPFEPSDPTGQILADAVLDKLSAITGGNAPVKLVTEIGTSKLRPGTAKGVYIPASEMHPAQILIDMLGPNPYGVGRHESIHWLYRQGFFTKDEWGALLKAATDGKWIEKYGIAERYAHLPEAIQIEESIAEAFRDWGRHTDKFASDSKVIQAFEKLRELFIQIREALRARFGERADDIFRQIESGEIGGREGAEPGKFHEPQFSIESANERMDQLRAEAAGLDAKSFKKLQDLIAKRHEEDVAAALKRAERNQKTIQTKEWKAHAAEIKTKVEESIRQRPDVLADLLVGGGEVAGKKIRQRIPLRAADLTADQKRGLPRHYYSEGGLPIDDAAGLVGFTSGDAMVEKLIEYNREKGNLSSNEMLTKAIEAETNRQMEKAYGRLDDNILLEAQDQALSETNLNILAEEWQGAAMAAGVQVVDKDVAKAEALRIFAKLKVGDISSTRFMTQMLSHYRAATQDLIAGKPADAVVRLQRRYMWGLITAEAKKLEKARVVFDRTAKQFSKREVKSSDPEYTNWIQDVLSRVGKLSRAIRPEDIRARIEARSETTLADFVAEKKRLYREMPVWDQLFDPSWQKDFDSLTAEEFGAVNDSIKALVWNAKDERKLVRQGEAVDYAEARAELIDAIDSSARGQVLGVEPRGVIRRKLKNYYVNSLQMENIFNRWDGFNSKGKWNQYVFRDLVDSDNRREATEKEIGKRLAAIKVPEGFRKAIDNPIFRHNSRGALLPLTRKNLIVAMLNSNPGGGKRSNLHKLAKGYGLEPEVVMDWINQHATADEWRFVQEIWDLHRDLKKRLDTTYRSISGGVEPESMPEGVIQTPHGEIKGGYYPAIYSREMEGGSKKLMGRDPLAEQGFVNTMPAAGHATTRTAYTAPIDLNLDALPNRLAQIIRDIEMRPALIEASKVFFDDKIRAAVDRHYGTEYRDMMIPYLQSVANSANQMTVFQREMSAVSEFFRKNLVTTLVGLNPGTVLKHGPTAAALSIREVGVKDFARAFAEVAPERFLHWTKALFMISHDTSNSAWEFAIKNSFELQRRDRNWAETLYGGSHSIIEPGARFLPFQEKVIQLASKPVAMSDMLSAVPTWLAKYEAERANGASHGDAISEADRAVRRAHGTTAATGRTGIQRDANPWLTSVYNFFSDVMNRQMETIWKAGEAAGYAKEGDWSVAKKATLPLIASVFAYSLWPAFVEHAVSGEETPEDEPWAKTAGKALVRSSASSWIGFRDVANFLVSGHDPQAGMTGTAMREALGVIKDLKKDHPLAREHRGRLLQDAAGSIGTLTGMMPAQVGRSTRFLHDVGTGEEHPRGPWAWLTGLRFGTTKHHSTTVQNYLRGKSQ